MTVSVRQATSRDASRVAPLFDAYRQFYRQPPDLAAAERFIRERLERGESLILLAEDLRSSGAEAATQLGANQPLGFVQLYPSFSSVRCNRLWVLNDLFVAAEARRAGVGEALLTAAANWARRENVSTISLTTAHDNVTAQRLYEKLGYVLDEEFRTYSLSIRS